MYKSPIELIAGEIQHEIENGLVRAVQSVGFDVDRDELERALRFDRDQYEHGYQDGARYGYEKALQDQFGNLRPASMFTPDPDERVLCITQTKAGRYNHVIGYYDGTRWCCGMNSNVVYWQPLPHAPKEE